jgi:hypothetical protein
MTARDHQGRYLKGRSGNPGGRMRGAILAQTVLRQELETHAPEIIRRQIEIARRGNPLVARFLLERLIPIAKSAPIETPIDLEGTPAEQAETILAALAAGKITMDSAQALLHALRLCQEIKDARELSSRLAEIERRLCVLTGEPPSPPPLPERPKSALPPPRTGSDEF